MIYAITAVVAGGGTWGILEIKERMESCELFFLGEWELDFHDFPGWMTPEIIAEIRSIDFCGSGERISLFEKGALVRFRERLLAVEWIRSVGEIRLEYPTSTERGSIRAMIAYRRPAAIIHVGDAFYLAAGDGMRLGGTYCPEGGGRSLRDWFNVPVITGVGHPAAVPERGRYWSDRGVLEGLEVARALDRAGIHETFRDRPIERIDVSNLDGRLRPGENEVELHSAGLILEWGRSPGSKNSRTLDVAGVLDNLRYVLSLAERDLRALRGRKIKLYFEKIVVDTA